MKRELTEECETVDEWLIKNLKMRMDKATYTEFKGKAMLGSLVQTLASLAGTTTTASPGPIAKATPQSAASDLCCQILNSLLQLVLRPEDCLQLQLQVCSILSRPWYIMLKNWAIMLCSYALKIILLCFLVSVIMLSIEPLCLCKLTIHLVTWSTMWPKQTVDLTQSQQSVLQDYVEVE